MLRPWRFPKTPKVSISRVPCTVKIKIMKINWGTGIFIFYSFFAATLFYQVYKSTQYDHSLVVENYYEKDLAYQATYNKLTNSIALNPPLKINHDDNSKMIHVEFPKSFKSVEGTVLLYRASNKKEDVNLPIRVNGDNQMDISAHTLGTGKWKIEIDWIGNKKPFLNRKTILISS